ncbi:hypothetical protein DUI87_01644 [Hirundo rustica rustica]|uniref:Uncharacterized protein n=1 Tax=Hirundo rustica rustica TaxID=333673 RepID=A0A3M0L557_HIRRU|nr:hypothetical protein DUI87_01644 [Hirundo rustica rustica]
MGLPPSSLIPTLAPVTYQSSRGGQNTKAIYHPFPQATIRDLCKAPKEYGKDSPYFRGLLKADLSGAETLPADSKQLFSCLLNSTEYRLWEGAWKQLLRDALPGLLDNIETMVDGHGNPLTFEHLVGEGQWMEATDQAALYPKCLNVGQSESFTDFVEKLSRAIEVQVKSEGARLKVSPIMCKWYVASLLSLVGVAAEKAIIHHYMDDVLVCAPTDDVLSHALDLTINALVVAGFELQEEKVQKMPPWKYLGLEIGKWTIVPQKLEIKAKIETLADVHQLCGSLYWVRPWLGLTTEDLAPLFNLLEGGEDLSSPRELTPEAKDALEKAKLSHQLFHQNAPGLVRRFHITQEQAKAIVATCPSGNQHALPTLSAGVNPRGLKSCEVWQTDVTHIPQFGRSKYVHVSVDTFSGAVFASAHTGEKTSDVIKHLIQAFSFMGIPRELKTDNGPAYCSREFSSFLQQWGVGHKTGIPHSPTGPAVVERTHREIKRVLNCYLR